MCTQDAQMHEGRWHIKPLWMDNMVRELATKCHGMTLIPGIHVVEGTR